MFWILVFVFFAVLIVGASWADHEIKVVHAKQAELAKKHGW